MEEFDLDITTIDSALASSNNNYYNVFTRLLEESFSKRQIIRAFFYMAHKLEDYNNLDLIEDYGKFKRDHSIDIATLEDTLENTPKKKSKYVSPLANPTELGKRRLALLQKLTIPPLRTISTCSEDRFIWHIYYWARKREKLEARKLETSEMLAYLNEMYSLESVH